MIGDKEKSWQESKASPEPRFAEHCAIEELEAYAAGELDSDEMVSIQTHVYECGECGVRLEQHWRNAAEQGMSADSELWHSLPGNERILREPIVLALDQQGEVRFVDGPEPLHENVIGTELRSSGVFSEPEILGVALSVQPPASGVATRPSARRHKWRLSDVTEPIIDLTVRVAESRKRVIELQISVQPSVSTRLEIYDETDKLFTSALLEDFSRRPLELTPGRWIIRIGAADSKYIRVLPLELREVIA